MKPSLPGKQACKICILFVGLLLPFLNCKSQAINITKCTDTNRLIVTPYVQLLKDSKNISLDSVLRPASQERFEHLPAQPVVFKGYEPYYYWFRIILLNPDTSVRQLMLSLGPVGMRDAELYQKKKDLWESLGKTGNQYPFDKRPYQFAHYIFPFTTTGVFSDTLYLRMDYSDDYRTYCFALLTPKALKRTENRFYYLFGIIIGLLLLFCLFNFYLFYTLKEKIHLWYTLHILAIIMVVLKHDQLDEQFLGLDSETAYRLTPIIFFVAISLSIQLLVIQSFTKNIRTNSFLYRLVKFLKYNLVLSACVHVVVTYFKMTIYIESFVFEWVRISSKMAVLSILILCVYSWFKGLKESLFLAAGLLVFIIGSYDRLSFNPTESFLFPPAMFHLGIVLEVMIISFGFVFRYNQDRREKRRHERETELLKTNYEKQILETKLEIQDQTFRNISEEIHQNIGKMLTSAKDDLAACRVKANEESMKKVEESENLLSKVISDLRDLSRSLNSDYVIEAGFLKAFDHELELLRKSAIFHVKMTVYGESYRLDPQKEIILFRICQEVLNNIIKHSEADLITVVIHFNSDELVISIVDNGRGFSVSETTQNHTVSGLGLKNVFARANSIGAQFRIESDKDAGTIVTIRVRNN